MPQSEAEHIVLIPWTGDQAKALAGAATVYPGRRFTVVDKKTLREEGFSAQRKRLRQFRGEALIFYFKSLDDASAPLLLAWTQCLHGCRATVLLDEAGNRKVYGSWSWLRLAPVTVCALFLDSLRLLSSLVRLQISLWRRQSASRVVVTSNMKIAYLLPFPIFPFEVGGAMSHIRGVVNGFKEAGAQCRFFTGRSLGISDVAEERVPLSREPFFFWEARAIAYNWRFAKSVLAAIRNDLPSVLYQRYGRFTMAGALLSRASGIPLVLEYNGSEIWAARNWDPSRFARWLRLCEEYALQSAALIVVVSEPLRHELTQRGIAAEKILVNPNAVDPKLFHPGVGGSEVRHELGVPSDCVVVGFAGSFSYWHGVHVLEEAIRRLLRDGNPQTAGKLRFLLIGDGLLRPEMAANLAPWVSTGQVIFTGSIPHDRVPTYLDATDIVLSPQVPFTDGSPFFGSPTKLFEYMAMGRAIVASNLGQIGQVISNGENGCLITPGNVEELVDAITNLALHPEIRARMGDRARETALARHTWRRNAQAVMEALGMPEKTRDTLHPLNTQVSRDTAARYSAETGR